MWFYAQIAAGKCYAVTQTREAVEQADMIPIASLDLSYLGRTWNGTAWL
jgi:hypothetical protein